MTTLFRNGDPVFSAIWAGPNQISRLLLRWYGPGDTYSAAVLSWKEAQAVVEEVHAHSMLRNEWAQDAGRVAPDPPPCTPAPPHMPNGPQRPPTASTIHQSAILQGFRHALSIVARRRAMESHPWGLAVLANTELMLLAELEVLENPLGPPMIGDPK